MALNIKSPRANITVM